MKKIKIRFIQYGLLEPTYCIQKKTLFGWKYIKFKLVNGTEMRYQNKDKEELLSEVIVEHYKNYISRTRITEFPGLKIY